MSNIQNQWDERQSNLGNTDRAVLFKNFPDSFNQAVHQAHLRFLMASMPGDAENMLDVGCGFGRLSLPLKERFTGLSIEGVEFCEEFAREFEKNVGLCFHGSAADFIPQKPYAFITVVTLLMYLDRQQQSALFARLWESLRPGGRLVVIEPYLNMLISLRRMLKLKKFAPTGGHVDYFSRKDLLELLAQIAPVTAISALRFINMPVTGFPRLHIGVCLEKPKG